MHVALLCVALSFVTAEPGATPTPATQAAVVRRTLSVGATGLVYVERSEPELDGVTIGGSIVVAARAHARVSVYFEGGRARFYADDQSGHRDFFASGLVGLHLRPGPGGFVLLAGGTLLHSEHHTAFGDLASNKAAVTLGADYACGVSELVWVAATWRTDIASGMTVHRPGVSIRLRF